MKVTKQQLLHNEILSAFSDKLNELGKTYIHSSLALAIAPHLDRQRLSSSQQMSLGATSRSKIGGGNIAGDDISSLLSLSLSSEDFARADAASTPSPPSSAQQMSLLDCLAIDKEKAWADRCLEVYLAVEKGMAELRSHFEEVKVAMRDLEQECIVDGQDKTEVIVTLVEVIEGHVEPQKASLGELKSSHLGVFAVITPTPTHTSIHHENEKLHAH